MSAVLRLSPSFVRVTFSGPELDAFHRGTLGTRDTRVKLVVPDRPGVRPSQIDVSDPAWYRRWLALHPRDRGHLRTYTARRLIASNDELVVDFVLHLDDAGRGGPATVWAAQARPGDRLTLLGPNREHPDPGGAEWRPPRPADGQRQQVLLVGDETALPAIASILETLPEQYAGDALVELPCMADAQPIRSASGVRVTYLSRNDRPRGVPTLETLTALLGPADPPGAHADPEPEIDELWETPEAIPTAEGLYAWVAGEASVVREVRRSLVGPYGVDRRQVAFMGYWRQGRAEG